MQSDRNDRRARSSHRRSESPHTVADLLRLIEVPAVA